MGAEPIASAERLALTLQFLATGESFRSLHVQLRISRRSISFIVSEVCEAITKKLGPCYLKGPSSEREWLQIAKQFKEKWNFPNCLGAIDRKHITLQPPPNSGSHYDNYKHTHSTQMLELMAAYQMLVYGISVPFLRHLKETSWEFHQLRHYHKGFALFHMSLWEIMHLH